MLSLMQSITPTVVLSILLLPASARVIWMQEEFDPLVNDSPLLRRDTSTCGGDSSLTPCGGALETSPSVTAAICCPQGRDCGTINPVSCDTSLQNTTITQLHVDPPQKLDTCGAACCPMGYTCRNQQCVAHTAPTPPPNAPTSTSTSSISSSTTSQSSASATSTPTAAGVLPLNAPNHSSDDDEDDFNGKSFAAGFIPGLFIGVFIAALLIFLCFRKKRKSSSDSYTNEKGRPRDTLTDLGTLEYRRPTLHGRSISEPQADPTVGHRTEFLRSTPPRAGEPASGNLQGYVVDVRSPASDPRTPSNSPPRIKALFSRSPFMGNQTPSTPRSTQPPIPAHLKRGTLSFKISPVRALKKQKSMHSLRRQVTSTSATRLRPDVSRGGSTETIQVLMPSNEPYTPERPAQIPEDPPTLPSATYQPYDPTPYTLSSNGRSPDNTPDKRNRSQSPPKNRYYASSSRYPSELAQAAYTTPVRHPPMPIPRGVAPTDGTLGSPYTPTNTLGNWRPKAENGALTVDGVDSRRDTTFSAMMERAGLRKSDLLMGSGSGNVGRKT
ncbi:hypothetical protein LTR37_009042 [Vermiconidia calcicola]|uniref:Uncharacterized protein n=1 Tax=Vermiconidia calcicola TaxID=1690605 RepID=A0ACC3NA73_9PEZI|nr:hypothetical protein LTR37_009042 [Vermiconidia calcicola]